MKLQCRYCLGHPIVMMCYVTVLHCSRDKVRAGGSSLEPEGCPREEQRSHGHISGTATRTSTTGNRPKLSSRSLHCALALTHSAVLPWTRLSQTLSPSRLARKAQVQELEATELEQWPHREAEAMRQSHSRAIQWPSLSQVCSSPCPSTCNYSTLKATDSPCGHDNLHPHRIPIEGFPSVKFSKKERYQSRSQRRC